MGKFVIGEVTNMCTCYEKHFSLNALLHTSQAYGHSPLRIL